MKEIIDLTKEVGEEKMTRRTFIVGSVVAVAALLSSDEVLAEEPTPRVLILEESESMYGPWTEVTGWDGFYSLTPNEDKSDGVSTHHFWYRKGIAEKPVLRLRDPETHPDPDCWIPWMYYDPERVNEIGRANRAYQESRRRRT